MSRQAETDERTALIARFVQSNPEYYQRQFEAIGGKSGFTWPFNPLAALLRLRTSLERRARGELGLAHEAEAAALARLEAVRARIGDAVPSDTLRPAQLRTLHLQGIRTQELVADAARQHESARVDTERAAERWRNRSAEADGVEELLADRSRRAAAKARVAADRGLDDLMAMLHKRGDR